MKWDYNIKGLTDSSQDIFSKEHPVETGCG
jgi:hypothetical protein